MEGPYHLETLILLLVAVLVLTALARRLPIPYPIFLVLGGSRSPSFPASPCVHLDPEVVFLIFLPPILWSAAYFTSLARLPGQSPPHHAPGGRAGRGDHRGGRDGRARGRTGHELAGRVRAGRDRLTPGRGRGHRLSPGSSASPIDWSPSLEGESLVNDASALILYRVAMAAMVTGGFVAPEALLAVHPRRGGRGDRRPRGGLLPPRALRVASGDPPQIAITLLAPYVAWILAERVSIPPRVLACVAGGPSTSGRASARRSRPIARARGPRGLGSVRRSS